MKIFLTIKNYRCFVQPVTIEISKGFTSFVGINNVGKSAIMRFLLEFRPFFKSYINNNPDSFFRSVLDIGQQNSQIFEPIHVLDPQEIFSNLNNNPIEFWFDFICEADENLAILPSKLYFRVFRNMNWVAKIYIKDEELVRANRMFETNGSILKLNYSPVVDGTFIFKLMKSLGDTLYIGPFRNTINVGTKVDYIDIQIGQSFIGQFKTLKTGNNKLNSLAISQLTKEITAIFGFSKLEINPSDDGQSLHLTINDKPYMQHELGSGLLQFILVLANVLVKKPAYVLIDEPELNLHPRLQLDFLTTLGTYAHQGVWFSTHSVGLARSASINVYSVLKKGEGDSIIRPIESIPRLSEFLGEMSFSSHKELGFEKILLVEGTTDVPVFQQFLRKLSKDHSVVILPLSGYINEKKLDQLEEIKRITPNLAVVIDSEKKTEETKLADDRQRFVDMCQLLKIPCHVLSRRATENYFPDKIIKLVFGGDYRGLEPFELIGETSKNWGKTQNYKLAKEMSVEDLEETDFWEFLKKL